MTKLSEVRLISIRQRLAEGFYLTRAVYEIIAEKVLKELSRKK